MQAITFWNISEQQQSFQMHDSPRTVPPALTTTYTEIKQTMINPSWYTYTHPSLENTHTHRVTEWTSQDLQLWKQNYYCANIKKTNYGNIIIIILRTKSRKGHCWLDLAGARQQIQQIPHMFSAGLRTGKFDSGHTHYLTFTGTLCKARLTYGLNISLCHTHTVIGTRLSGAQNVKWQEACKVPHRPLKL